MISNNLILLSQKLNTNNFVMNKAKDYNTNPQKKILNPLMKAKLAQSHINLFNFINDNRF